VCYANALKVSLLGVDPAILEEHGAVSEAAARAMAAGACDALGVDLSVAVTGIAGPGGGSDDKPVGTVWLALADAGGVEAQRIRFPGDRHDVRARAAQAALALLDRRLRAPASGA
jgi:PncC family amidohydrolase